MNQQRRALIKYSAVFGLMASAGLISIAMQRNGIKQHLKAKASMMFLNP